MQIGLILPYRGIVPKLDPSTFVAPTAAVIGDVEVGPDCGIWFGCTVRGDVNNIRIGPRTNIQDGTVIHVSSTLQGTYIGEEVTIGHMALLHACTLEPRCFIGMKCCVMDGAVVEEGGMVAAGALVGPGKRVRKGELWAGVPAKPIRQLSEEEIAGWPAFVDRYVRLAREYGGK